MHKRYTRAQKRQIVQNLFKRRNFQYISKYIEKKKEVSIREWQKVQEELKSWINGRVDEGIREDTFFEILKGHGWIVDQEVVEKENLLLDYIEDLEYLYPDTYQEEETVTELGPELEELRKEKV